MAWVRMGVQFHWKAVALMAASIILSLGAPLPSGTSGSSSLVVIDFGTDANRRLLPALQAEIASTPGQWMGVRIVSRDDPRRTNFSTDLILALVTGDCMVPAKVRPWRPQPLGWVEKVDGQFLSIVHLDCARIGEAVARERSARRYTDSDLARGMARVLRHELTHLERGSAVHDLCGDFQATLTSKQLLARPPIHLQ